MNCCAIDAHFGRERAEDDVARYREVGPEGTTRMLLELLPADAWAAEHVLDIGGGVGMLALELLDRNAERATLVEISSSPPPSWSPSTGWSAVTPTWPACLRPPPAAAAAGWR